MQLLLQIWCPFEDSPMDRALYVWGCLRGSCQKKDGSIRAWRGLRFNEKYAAKLENKLMKKRERERAKAEAAATEEAKKAVPKTNPFAISASTADTSSNPFGLGDQIFGSAPISSAARPTVLESQDLETTFSNDEDSDNESDTSEQSLTIALAATTLDDSTWKAAPAYAPLYLSTASEYLPPLPKAKLPANVQILDPDTRDKNDPTWTSEAYENSLEIDNVFDRFAKRVAHESEQCLRYELKGTPLPFANDTVFDKLFPEPKSNITTVSKATFNVSPPAKRTYSPSTSGLIPPCPVCKAPRAFECQLMPNLINVLKALQDKPEDPKKQTEEERRKAVAQALKGGDGMSWGTAMIFSCEKDCCISTEGQVKEQRECWREEVVLIQWDA
ncbi:hypothetical protein P691DRAFT_808479 [Macrolepiota fuliginosa MF-IS2]|uniref:Programmed cell death protein 2 C-terminal domain-containing protein n=1 Tax=Macrolepiota fuliginosa MF-IS2 TaxID=1400762 RepID=A0A9P5X5C8_9AGAR|nr:hypothetical protein P691DRAFT_808479 [Macrolepiota fuliginosa MF-IS2]